MSLKVRKLSLTNFRSYKKAKFEFGDRTVIVGANASGKTNLLEALYLLSSGKSFRADRELEMISWGETAGRVATVATLSGGAGTQHNAKESRSQEFEAVVQLSAGPSGRTAQKAFQVDRRKLTPKEAAALLPMVLFSADDVRLVDGAPGRRRRALDLAIGQASPTYRTAGSRYAKVLASRNRLLETIASGESSAGELDFWDQELIEAGQVVIEQRVEFVRYLNARLSEAYAAIAVLPPGRVAPPAGLQLDYQPLMSDLAAGLPARRAQDIAVGTTTAGPHRDDWKLLLGNRPLSSFGSGGEYRSALLAFRLCEADWLSGQRLVPPIILLDDVFSELDEYRRSALLASLPAGQTIITTPEADVLPRAFSESATVLAIPAPTNQTSANQLAPPHGTSADV